MTEFFHQNHVQIKYTACISSGNPVLKSHCLLHPNNPHLNLWLVQLLGLFSLNAITRDDAANAGGKCKTHYLKFQDQFTKG